MAQQPFIGESKPGLCRWLLLLGGLLLTQAVLFGPSLIGRKILLPLDLLTVPGRYIPNTVNSPPVQPHTPDATDLIYLMEPARRFAASELRARRFPSWAPYEYGGVPCSFPRFSPLLALEYSTRSPVVLAWGQLLAALVAGAGAFLFFRHALGVSYWPAAICSWCYPLTAFFIFWQGYFTALSVYWLPWILLAVDLTARRRHAWGLPALSMATALVLASGHLDVAGQVLLASGLYGLWWVFAGGDWRRALRAASRLAAGWALGFLLASPYVLPLTEYARTGARFALRTSGFEERPPAGLVALPQVVLPDMYGSMNYPSLRLARDHQSESSAAGYVGMLATLLAAPLAFCSQRHRKFTLCWAGLAFFSLGWCLNVPGLASLFRLPGLNLMSHNRLVFITAFALVSLAAIGLEVLRDGLASNRWWFWAPQGLLAGLLVWCVYRSAQLPSALTVSVPQMVQEGKPVLWAHDLEGVARAQHWQAHYYAISAFWCALGILGWGLLRARQSSQARFLPLLGLAMAGELLWFSFGRNTQSDPAFYFPPVPALEAVAKAVPGRVLGYNCLLPNLAGMANLSDLRGYDGVDPARMTELLWAGADAKSQQASFALTALLIPRARFNDFGQLQLLPLFDLLGVRYVIFRGTPPPNARPWFQSPDYWVMENTNALDRVFVPRRVELVADRDARLQKLATVEFNPREIAYTETPVNLPAICRGSARIESEIPTQLAVAVTMETPAMLVLGDRWDAGWKAYLDGQLTPVLRVNHALRGVAVPAGPHRVLFRYQPESFAWGLKLAVLAAVSLMGWTATLAWAATRGHDSRGNQPAPSAR